MKPAGAIEVTIWEDGKVVDTQTAKELMAYVVRGGTGYAMTEQQLQAFASKCFDAGVNSIRFRGLSLHDRANMSFGVQPRGQVVVMEEQTQTFSDFWQAIKEEGNE